MLFDSLIQVFVDQLTILNRQCLQPEFVNLPMQYRVQWADPLSYEYVV